MAKYKGTRYETIRKVIRRHGREVEEAFLAKLTPSEHQKYLYGLPVSWYPVEEIPEKGDVFQAAAEVLFPGDPEGMRKVGRLNAVESLTGIYKLFLRIPSIEFVIGRAAKLWRSYQDTGIATAEDFAANSGAFVVRGYPDLREDFREYLAGYVAGVLEVTGAKNIRVRIDDGKPDVIRWVAAWD